MLVGAAGLGSWGSRADVNGRRLYGSIIPTINGEMPGVFSATSMELANGAAAHAAAYVQYHWPRHHNHYVATKTPSTTGVEKCTDAPAMVNEVAPTSRSPATQVEKKLQSIRQYVWRRPKAHGPSNTASSDPPGSPNPSQRPKHQQRDEPQQTDTRKMNTRLEVP